MIHPFYYDEAGCFAEETPCANGSGGGGGGVKFKTTAVLSVYGGKLICEFGDVMHLMSHLISRPIFTHEMPSFADVCSEELRGQFPFLADYDDSSVNAENWKEWADRHNALYGEELEVMPIEKFNPRGPLETAIEIFGADRVIAVSTEGDAE